MKNNDNFESNNQLAENEDTKNTIPPEQNQPEQNTEVHSPPVTVQKDKLNIQNDRINFFPNPQYLLENFEIHEEPILEISRDDSNSYSNESYEDARFTNQVKETTMIPIKKTLNAKKEGDCANEEISKENCDRCENEAEYYVNDKFEVALCKKCSQKSCLIEYNLEGYLTNEEKLRKKQIDEFLGQVDHAKKSQNSLTERQTQIKEKISKFYRQEFTKMSSVFGEQLTKFQDVYNK